MRMNPFIAVAATSMAISNLMDIHYHGFVSAVNPKQFGVDWEKKSFYSYVDHEKVQEEDPLCKITLKIMTTSTSRGRLDADIEPWETAEMRNAAEKVGASMVVLEHRYSGNSIPTEEFSVDILRKLFTTKQTVEDMALFGRHIKGKIPELKIVLFGCSSAGTVAALARKHHPDIFDGVIASSAPLKFQLENDKYNEVLAKDFSNQKLKGSEKCLEVIKEAHKSIGSSLESAEGRRQLETNFQLYKGDLEDEKIRTAFAINGRLLSTGLQYNDPSCRTDYCNIERICRRLTTGSEPSIDKLLDVYKKNNPSSLGRSMADDFQRLFKRCFLGLSTLIISGCNEGFGITKDEVLTMVKEMQTYVGDFSKVTNMLSINGHADPWYPSSITENAEGPDVLNVPDASHCYWCNKGNEDVFKRVRDAILKWIA
ncbi:Thymus-specific serine protease [Perkinsus chesapeaki]|uniref:Thymus-specific serine protease n=1 Tax=Perkinsus chesapeaki TaxID=330153 RepID=A0A7J6MFT3_PERCH|nr:Thymus-specific serine protease [Perkinsus chesapeaki]